ncbi:MAG: ATP-grasp domain-containing protein [Proteobacteria bacterium]|nr:ATP-grasp domain-containing protein [Pseudomonadota bacterium]
MRKTPRLRVVIVDGYSTGRELVRELLNREVECLHLQSTRDVPLEVVKGFDRRPYDGDLGYLGRVPTAVDALRSLKPDVVIAGSEWGVNFAEAVAFRMGLPTNRVETIGARRDKYEMVEAVRRRGLRAASQALVSNAEEARAWAVGHGAWPIVVKPLDSAGSDGVSICSELRDVEAAVGRDLGRRNFMGSINRQLLLQSYLSGPQFIVNTVSSEGRHHVTDIWAMTVTVAGGDVIPGGIHLCDPETATSAELIAYTLEVLSALGIENGAAHTELKWTPDGPALIETGARLMGAAMDEPSYAAAGMHTQANVLAEVLGGCPEEREAVLSACHYHFEKHISKVLFNFGASGRVRSTEALERLQSLPSFHAHYRPLRRGDRVWKTADWFACGGMIYLVHDNPGQIAADIETVRIWESRGALYDIETDVAAIA